MVLAAQQAPTYFAWDGFGKKSTAVGRLLQACDLYREQYGENATHALLNPQDAAELRAARFRTPGLSIKTHDSVSVGEVRLMLPGRM